MKEITLTPDFKTKYADRNKAIYRYFTDGITVNNIKMFPTMQELGNRYSLKRQRIEQIIRRERSREEHEGDNKSRNVRK